MDRWVNKGTAVTFFFSHQDNHSQKYIVFFFYFQVRQSCVLPAAEAARHLKDSLSGVRAQPSRCDPGHLSAAEELRFHPDDEPQVGPKHLEDISGRCRFPLPESVI